MKTYLLLSKIKIINANAVNSPYSIGFPAMTAWLGAVHALQRKLQAAGWKIEFPQTAIVCHKCELQVYKDTFAKHIIGTANPLKKKGANFKKPPFIEEGRCHLTVSLLIEIDNLDSDYEDEFKEAVQTALNKMKMAGGDIISFKDAAIYSDIEEDDKISSQLKSKLMPGYVIIERRNLLEKAMSDNLDGLDALLKYLKVNYTSIEDKETKKPVWKGKREAPGWIIPMGVGFKGISDLGKVKNQRDANIKHRFAESVITLCEFKMPYRIEEISDMMWHYEVDKEKALYVCKNQK